jgi:hypothetical protein
MPEKKTHRLEPVRETMQLDTGCNWYCSVCCLHSQYVDDPEVGDPKMAIRKYTKIGDIGDCGRGYTASPLVWRSIVSSL